MTNRDSRASSVGGWRMDCGSARAARRDLRSGRLRFSSLPEAEEVDTIGGLIIAAAGRVPNRGEILLGPGEFEYEVLDADPRRIKRVKIRPLAAELPRSRLRRLPDPRGEPVTNAGKTLAARGLASRRIAWPSDRRAVMRDSDASNANQSSLTNPCNSSQTPAHDPRI